MRNEPRLAALRLRNAIRHGLDVICVVRAQAIANWPARRRCRAGDVPLDERRNRLNRTGMADRAGPARSSYVALALDFMALRDRDGT